MDLASVVVILIIPSQLQPLSSFSLPGLGNAAAFFD